MFNFDRRTIYIVLAILIIMNLAQYLTDSQALLGLVLTLPGVIIAITFHEFAHAFAADRLGDDTPRRQGRLNLNPLSHMDPIGFTLLLFAGFGWGRPVEINPVKFNRKHSMETGEAIVAFAGPLMNFILAIVGTLIYFAMYRFATSFMFTQTGIIVTILLQGIIVTNIGLGVFNLIPLPPLDGSKVLIRFLPTGAKNWFIQNEQIFYIVFIVIWITGIAGSVISPAIQAMYNGLIGFFAQIFGFTILS